MVTVRFSHGVHLPAADLWLDPRGRKAFAFVSHAHSDHTGRHDKILCTPTTARLTAARTGIPSESFLTVPFGERTLFDSWAGTLLPAGHVLGSAQLFFENDEGTLLYTGDFKRRQGLSSEVAETCSAETLIMETTYGLPKYRFPPAQESVAQIHKFCFEALEDGETPVLLGYSLGKAQEILSAISGGGFTIMLHASIASLISIYRDCGVTLPDFVPWNAQEARGHVLVCPPGASASLRKIRNRRVAAVTGWAMDPGALHRMGVDAAIPMSDHADYEELLAHVAAVQPKRVLTLHGFAQEFARDLRQRGIEAWALTGPNQLEWELTGGMTSTRSAEMPERALVRDGLEGFAALCDQIRSTTGKLKKIGLLSSYFQRLPEDDLASAAIWFTGRPFAQNDPRPLQVGTAVLRQALAIVRSVPEAEIRAIARRNNDFGITTAEVLSSDSGPPNRPDFLQTRTLFENLSAAKSPHERSTLLAGFLKGLHPLVGRALVGILLGDLRIGLKEGLVEDSLAAAFDAEPSELREAHMLTGDIGQVARLAAGKRLSSAGLTLFRPIKCMLASPEPDAAAVWSRLGTGGSVWLEHKMDGVRAQLHCAPAQSRIFSRELHDLTASFPEISMAGCALGVEAVLDGEILAWRDGQALPFQNLQKRLGRQQDDLFVTGQVPVAFLAFDVLYLNGRTLIHQSLEERRRHLEALTWQHPLLPLPVRQVASAEAIDAAFEEARAAGNEGLLAKDPASLYRPGRRGLAWIKLKKKFATLDVVVTAAEFGHGRRRDVLSDYTFAVRHGQSFLPIGKAYSGLTDAEIEELTAVFLASVLHREGNRLDVEPRIVLEIAFDAIQASDRHASGLALRFPRIVRIRHDKTPQDIDTLTRARKLIPKPRSVQTEFFGT